MGMYGEFTLRSRDSLLYSFKLVCVNRQPIKTVIAFTYVDWVEAKSVLISNSYPLVTVTDRIMHTYYKSNGHNRLRCSGGV